MESQALDGFNFFNGWAGGSISFWMRVGAAVAQTWANNTNHDLFFKYNVLQARVFKDASGQLKFMTTHSNGTSFGTWVTSVTSIPTDTWLHVVTTHAGTTASIYFNGQPVGTGSTGKNLGVASNDVFEISTYDGRFVGYIDDFQVYNRAITQAEAAELASGTGVPVQTYTITSTASTGGTISPSGASTVTAGGNQVFVIAPNSGYQISQVLVDGIDQGAISSYTFTAVSADHVISASFSQIPQVSYTITSTADIGGVNHSFWSSKC